MRTTPQISVVTASFNAGDFIDQCVRSVAEQDLPNVEHVVIDGGSTDGTVEIVERYAHRLSYWHSKADRGVGHAYNLGLEHSRGEWLLFLNADDYFCRSDALRLLAERASSSGRVDAVYGQVQTVSRERNPRMVGRPTGWPYSPWAFLLKNLIPHPATLTHRTYFERVGPFREDLMIVDYEHYLRSYRSLRTAFLPEVLSHWRLGGGSDDTRVSLGEMFRAQELNRSLPPIALALLRAFVRSKATAGRMVRAVPKTFSGSGSTGSRAI